MGKCRQQLHEKLRVHARASAEARLAGSGAPDLLDRIAKDPAFAMTAADLRRAADPQRLIGRSSEQVFAFVREELDPALEGVSRAEAAPVRV